MLGRLLARLAVALRRRASGRVGNEPGAARRRGRLRVIVPDDDPPRLPHDLRRQRRSRLLDTLSRLAPGGEIVLAGFYEPLCFAFPPAFMREARIRVAAEWRDPDLVAFAAGRIGTLSLDGLITHRRAGDARRRGLRTAFDDPACLKMILDWRARS